LYYDGTNYNLAGGGMIIGTDPNPGGGEKLRVGGGIFSTAAQTIDLGTGALPAFASPLELLLGAADGQAVRVNGYAHGATGMGIRGFAASGTRSAPTAVNGLGLVVVAGGGYDGSAWQDSATYYIQTADGLWSGTNRGTYHAWVGTPNGSTVAAEWMRLKSAALIIGTDPNPGGTEKLRVGGTAITGAHIINTGGTSNVYFAWTNAGVSRWLVAINGTESGGNAGSNLAFNNYADGGAQISTVMTLERSTGNAIFASDIVQTGGKYHYLRGDASTDGSVRISSQASGAATLEKRASGSWTTLQAWS
jgi:hypothetical protein